MKIAKSFGCDVVAFSSTAAKRDDAFAIARTRSATVGSLKAPAPKATAKCLAPSFTDRN